MILHPQNILALYIKENNILALSLREINSLAQPKPKNPTPRRS